MKKIIFRVFLAVVVAGFKLSDAAGAGTCIHTATGAVSDWDWFNETYPNQEERNQWCMNNYCWGYGRASFINTYSHTNPLCTCYHENCAAGGGTACNPCGGAGHESCITSTSCPVGGGTCATGPTYRCQAGFWGTSTTSCTGCQSCGSWDSGNGGPVLTGTNAAGNSAVTTCCIEARTGLTDNRGTFNIARCCRTS